LRNGSLINAVTLSLVLCSSLPIGLPAQAANAGHALANASVVINATPKVVWQAIHEERFQDPDIAYSKILQHSANSDVVEQKFVGIPILGSVVVVTRQNEVPLKEINYSLVSSDKFKAMEGSWALTPSGSGKQTTLSLSSYLDVGVPFSGFFIRSATQKKIAQRIANVKTLAEREQAQLAARGKEDL
jgi:hypothetical protein